MISLGRMNEWDDQLIQQALLEDAARQDFTAMATMPIGADACACISAKGDGVLSGVEIADAVFEKLDASIGRTWHFADGDNVCIGDVVCELSGPVVSLLSAERTALNFLQHLSGIATATHLFVEAVKGTACRIVDTRKTTPGFRHLEKQAVLHGGGVNHRMDLGSGMLIKENHIQACGSIAAAVQACYHFDADLWVEVECETLAEVHEAVAVCPDIILLDNMSPAVVAQARVMVPESIVLEASGNITLSNARAYADTGVDRIAIGAITHSAPVLDLSMRMLPAVDQADA
ncbi:MAG: carboxylating nicotinate-nucleotide diphosphorylase [Mariprofundus sp.]